MDDPLRSIGAFCVSIFHTSAKEPLREYNGTGAEWQLKPVLTVPVGEYSYSVRIDGLWVELLRGSETRLEREVDGLCTIIKFGDTLQLREPFRVVIEVEG